MLTKFKAGMASVLGFKISQYSDPSLVWQTTLFHLIYHIIKVPFTEKAKLTHYPDWLPEVFTTSGIAWLFLSGY